MSGLSVPSSKVYDGTTAASVSGTPALLAAEATGSGTGLDGKSYTGDTVSITGTATGTYNSKDVATASSVSYGGLTLTGAQAGNYSLTMQSSASATISAKALTMSGLSVPSSKVYDGTTAASVSGTPALLTAEAAGSGTGLDGKSYTGDTVSITGTATGTYNSKNVAMASSVSYGGLSLTGAQAGNYSLTVQAPASATITAKPLTLTGLTVTDKIYDGTTTASVSGVAQLQSSEAAGFGTGSSGKPYSGDDVSLSGGLASASFSNPNVGSSKTVTVSGFSLSGADAGNYSVGSATTSAAIDKAHLTVTADNQTRLYGQANPTFTQTIRSPTAHREAETAKAHRG